MSRIFVLIYGIFIDERQNKLTFYFYLQVFVNDFSDLINRLIPARLELNTHGLVTKIFQGEL
jgi:hypothetical protein